MCTAFFLFGVHPRLKFLFLFNRDEFLERATAPAAFWPDHPDILAGRDLKNGGTWCGVTRGGRFALLTNFRERDPGRVDGAPSRGSLPLGFLRGGRRPIEYLRSLDLERHNGFNLVVGDLNDGVEVAYVTNRCSSSTSASTSSSPQQLEGPVLLPPGVYGISNGVLGDSWVKVDRGVSILKRMLEAGEFDSNEEKNENDDDASSPSPSPSLSTTTADFPWDSLFRSLMGDTSRAPPHRVPETGIPRHIEERLTPTFVTPFELMPKGNGGGGSGATTTAAATGATTTSLLKKYGTRSQTALAVFSGGKAELRERRLVSWCEEDGAVLRAGGEEEEEGDEEPRGCPEGEATAAAPLPPPFPLESCPIKSEWREVSHTFIVRSLAGTTAEKEEEVGGGGESQQQRQRKARRDELVVDEAADASVSAEFEEEGAELKTAAS